MAQGWQSILFQEQGLNSSLIKYSQVSLGIYWNLEDFREDSIVFEALVVMSHERKWNQTLLPRGRLCHSIKAVLTSGSGGKGQKALSWTAICTQHRTHAYKSISRES
jgi:hypothetical protein